MAKYVLQLYIYTATFYGFYILSKFVQIWFTRPVIVVGAVITHKMCDAGTKDLSATDARLKSFLDHSANHQNVS